MSSTESYLQFTFVVFPRVRPCADSSEVLVIFLSRVVKEIALMRVATIFSFCYTLGMRTGLLELDEINLFSLGFSVKVSS